MDVNNEVAELKARVAALERIVRVRIESRCPRKMPALPVHKPAVPKSMQVRSDYTGVLRRVLTHAGGGQKIRKKDVNEVK
jgi:hypothetical protein